MKKIKKKRVMYPWIKFSYSRMYKCMIAFICDNEIDWDKWLGSKKSVKKLFDKKVYPKLKFFFPKMYLKVAKFYSKRGRSISEGDFKTISYLRMACIYKISKRSRTVIKTREHPDLCRQEDIKKSFKTAQKIYDSGEPYKKVGK